MISRYLIKFLMEVERSFKFALILHYVLPEEKIMGAPRTPIYLHRLALLNTYNIVLLFTNFVLFSCLGF